MLLVVVTRRWMVIVVFLRLLALRWDAAAPAPNLWDGSVVHSLSTREWALTKLCAAGDWPSRCARRAVRRPIATACMRTTASLHTKPNLVAKILRTVLSLLPEDLPFVSDAEGAIARPPLGDAGFSSPLSPSDTIIWTFVYPVNLRHRYINCMSDI